MASLDGLFYDDSTVALNTNLSQTTTLATLPTFSVSNTQSVQINATVALTLNVSSGNNLDFNILFQLQRVAGGITTTVRQVTQSMAIQTPNSSNTNFFPSFSVVDTPGTVTATYQIIATIQWLGGAATANFTATSTTDMTALLITPL
ncbi:hypothetical protein IC620_13815 [Hazenella sp. IB182357]|uniref:Uncharacterized protein n=1 Tax=Polycladospora coralii TaxID=2771432 RepID=A0A926RV55_9BACL|nr:hypothetical protein [Polycladospora coralii]MBD1373427.1 hypothetical protein [Polycladospora coralii]